MMLSSTAQRGIVEKHADLPVSVYLNKPISSVELFESLIKPLKKESAQISPKENKVLTGAPQVKKNIDILLAEDNHVNQKLALRMLDKLGYTVTLAENGLKAYQAYMQRVDEQREFDLILMDVQMPEMGGFEATAKIREEEKMRGKRKTPIIAMTAHAIQGYREKCFQGGMDGYISKPIQLALVKKTLEEFVEVIYAQRRGEEVKKLTHNLTSTISHERQLLSTSPIRRNSYDRTAHSQIRSTEDHHKDLSMAIDAPPKQAKDEPKFKTAENVDKKLTASYNQEELQKLYGEKRSSSPRKERKIEEIPANNLNKEEAMMRDAEAILLEKAEELKGLTSNLPPSLLNAIPSYLVPNRNNITVSIQTPLSMTTPVSSVDTPTEERKVRTKKKELSQVNEFN